MYTYINICLYMYIYTYIYLYIYMYICVCICVGVNIYVYICICICIYIYIYCWRKKANKLQVHRFKGWTCSVFVFFLTQYVHHSTLMYWALFYESQNFTLYIYIYIEYVLSIWWDREKSKRLYFHPHKTVCPLIRVFCYKILWWSSE